MSNIFAELQMLSSNKMNSVVDTRKDLNRLLEYFLSRKDRIAMTSKFAVEVRNLKAQTLLDCDSFMIETDDDYIDLDNELMEDRYGIFRGNWCIYGGRYIFPVKDVKGDVMGWCGYDKFSDTKYLDSDNYGYKAKYATVYGMEKLGEYYKSGRQVFFTEGIICTLYARQEGEQALATLGSSLTPYVAEIIRRFGDRARIITDSDEAGNKFKKQARYLCPKARVIQSKIAKDLDDSKEVNPNVGKELCKFENRFYRSPYFT